MLADKIHEGRTCMYGLFIAFYLSILPCVLTLTCIIHTRSYCKAKLAAYQCGTRSSSPRR